MLGLGETPEEIYATIADIRGAGVEIMTLGQYLQPTPKHLPVDRWVHPDEFAAYRDFALSLGFAHCESGPLVRSSYHAHEHVRPALEGEGARTSTDDRDEHGPEEKAVLRAVPSVSPCSSVSVRVRRGPGGPLCASRPNR